LDSSANLDTSTIWEGHPFLLADSMFDYRFFTLLGSDFIFAVVSLTLFFYPELALYVYPGYSLIFFWSDFRKEGEIHVIFLFLVGLVGIYLVSLQTHLAAQLAAGVEIASVWALSFALGVRRNRSAADESATLEAVADLEKRILDHERDLRFYSTYEENVSGQVQLRRDLIVAAREIGSTMDAQEVKERLLKIVTRRYPKAKAQIISGIPADPLVEWSLNTQAPVLVKDMLTDDRFSYLKGTAPFRSALAVPLKILGKTAGFLRFSSDRPGEFSTKDLRPVDLLATLTALSLENIQLFENVSNLAVHDGLTQLFTHGAFQTKLQEELLRAGRSQTPLSLIIADVDFFKHYNDTYGHQAGDLVLRTLASIFSHYVRPVDFVARYGGEEFAIILPNIVRSQTGELANRIRMRVESEPFVFQGRATQVTVSFGVSSFPQDATTPSQLIRMADERLYRAKENGRNQVIG